MTSTASVGGPHERIKQLGTLWRTLTIHRLGMPAIAIMLVASTFQANASRVPIEYREFKSLCSVVEFEGDHELQTRANQSVTDSTVAEHIKSYLQRSSMSVPIESGRQCYPGKFGSSPWQLSLQFYAVLGNGPIGSGTIALAVTVHVYREGKETQPHEFSTRLLFCDAKEYLPRCVSQHITAYADATVLSLIVTAKRQ